MLMIAKPSKLPIFTRGRVARVTTEGVVPGLEHEWPDTRVWPDLLWNICMQRPMSVRNDCTQNGWMDRSTRFHRRNMMINGSMEAPWLDLYWVGMNLQLGHRSTADL